MSRRPSLQPGSGLIEGGSEPCVDGTRPACQHSCTAPSGSLSGGRRQATSQVELNTTSGGLTPSLSSCPRLGNSKLLGPGSWVPKEGSRHSTWPRSLQGRSPCTHRLCALAWGVVGTRAVSSHPQLKGENKLAAFVSPCWALLRHSWPTPSRSSSPSCLRPFLKSHIRTQSIQKVPCDVSWPYIPPTGACEPVPVHAHTRTHMHALSQAPKENAASLGMSRWKEINLISYIRLLSD